MKLVKGERSLFFLLFFLLFLVSPFENESRERVRVPTDANVSLFVARTARQITDAKRDTSTANFTL